MGGCLMNIIKYKGKGYDTDSKHLFYVEFQYGDLSLKWYPKWKDLGPIFLQGFVTEANAPVKKWTPYFKLICAEILYKAIVHDEIHCDRATWVELQELMAKLAKPFEKGEK